MTKCYSILLIAITGGCFLGSVQAQNAGIGTVTPHASAQLDITSGNKGLLIPRMLTGSMMAIPNPAKGLLVYDSAVNHLMVNIGTPATPIWQNLIGNNWGLTGNGGTNGALNYIGTNDNQPFLIKIKNQWSGVIDSVSGSTYLGYLAGRDSAGTPYNTALGSHALNTDVKGIGFNTALGAFALNLNKTGYNNTAAGAGALNNNTSGADNTALGGALARNNGGFQNTAIGSGALNNLWTPPGQPNNLYNTAIGIDAAKNLGVGNYNTVNGYQVMLNAASGNGNTVNGALALNTLLSGNYNTVEGCYAMYKSLGGYDNTILGPFALYYEVSNEPVNDRDTTYQNTAVGYKSLALTHPANGNTAFGYLAGAAKNNGYYNCFIGAETDVTIKNLYNTILLGHSATTDVASTMRVGNTATTSIGGPVGWSTVSDGRAKKNIRENIPGLAFISKLRPVTYTINTAAVAAFQKMEATDTSSSGSRQATELMSSAYKAKEKIVYTGFIAQKVAQTAKSIHYDFNGVDAPPTNQQLYALRYEAFVMPLVKSVQELSVQNNQLSGNTASLQKDYEQILKRLDMLDKKLK